MHHFTSTPGTSTKCPALSAAALSLFHFFLFYYYYYSAHCLPCLMPTTPTPLHTLLDDGENLVIPPLSLFAFFHLSVFLLFCSVRSGEADRPHSTGRPRRPFLTRLSFTPLPHPSVSSFQPTNAPRSPCCLFTCPFTFIFSESGLTPSQTG